MGENQEVRTTWSIQTNNSQLLKEVVADTQGMRSLSTIINNGIFDVEGFEFEGKTYAEWIRDRIVDGTRPQPLTRLGIGAGAGYRWVVRWFRWYDLDRDATEPISRSHETPISEDLRIYPSDLKQLGMHCWNSIQGVRSGTKGAWKEPFRSLHILGIPCDQKLFNEIIDIWLFVTLLSSCPSFSADDSLFFMHVEQEPIRPDEV